MVAEGAISPTDRKKAGGTGIQATSRPDGWSLKATGDETTMRGVAPSCDEERRISPSTRVQPAQPGPPAGGLSPWKVTTLPSWSVSTMRE